jgi:hypothetical protein
LLAAGGSGAAHKRDIHLLRDNLDFNDPALEAAFRRYLDPDDPKFKQLQFRAACLVGYNSDAYPTKPNTKIEKDVKDSIEAGLGELWTKVQNRVLKEKLDTFALEVFCIPFPDVEAFRTAFRSELQIG